MNQFEKLDIIEPILKSIREQGFKKPMPIQYKAIPDILLGEDVIATSATGSGKTLAFAIRCIEVCDLNKGVQSLVLVPTRELAKQVHADIEKLSKYSHVKLALLYGGLSVEKERKSLCDANIVVATTGKLFEHVKQENISFENMKLLVIDEVDMMIDKEFIPDLEEVFELVPDYVQKLMFSATINEDLLKLASKYMNNPKKIAAQFSVDRDKLSQIYYEVPENLKLSLIVYLLRYQRAGLSLIFTNRHETSEFLAKNIRANTSLVVECVHGGQSAGKRNRILRDFREEKIDVLVTTDVAARGLDIAGITHVYNYTIPKDRDKYTHRIGRTARAGKEGKVINFISKKDQELFVKILQEDYRYLIMKRLPELDDVNIKGDDKSNRKIVKVGNKKYVR